MNTKQNIYMEMLRIGTIHLRNKLDCNPSVTVSAIQSASAIAELLHGIPPLVIEPSIRGDVYFLNSAIGQFISTFGDVTDVAFDSLCKLILELEREVQKETLFSWKISEENKKKFFKG